MKVVAVALVLIAGAAVVLWYGNTSNSWVVGGLIGGLAALLLSIPISLTLFSYLSRRHDERVRAEEALVEERISLSQIDDNPRFSPRSSRRDQKYIESSLYDPQVSYALDEDRYERDMRQRLPSQKRLPAAKNAVHGSSLSRELPVAPTQSGKTRHLSESEKDADRTLPARKQYPGLPASEIAATRVKQRSQALRTARLEASRQQEERTPRSTQSLRYSPPARPAREGAGSTNESEKARRTRQLSEQANSVTGRMRVDGRTNENTLGREERPTRLQRRKESETDTSPRSTVETDAILPKTEPTRHPHIAQEYQRTEEDIDRNHRTRPLIRRAPYLYEDDPLRQELSQHLDIPSVRRSSRNESTVEDEEDT